MDLYEAAVDLDEAAIEAQIRQDDLMALAEPFLDDLGLPR